MKKILLPSAIAALALAASAQNNETTTDQPGVVVMKAFTTEALAKDIAARGMKTTMDKLTEALDNHLSAAIVSSDKFTVLQRGPELNKLLDEPTKLGDALRLAENDFGIFIKLDHYLDKSVKRTVGARVFEGRLLQLNGQVTVVGGASAKVLAMSNLEITSGDDEDGDVDNLTQENASLEILLPRITRKFANESYEFLMDKVFPMLVIDVDGSVITVDRGTGFLKKGEKIEIYGPSRTVVNPRTNKEMEIKGKLVGTATVSSVESDYSQAKTDGKFDVPEFAEARKIKTKGSAGE